MKYLPASLLLLLFSLPYGQVAAQGFEGFINYDFTFALGESAELDSVLAARGVSREEAVASLNGSIDVYMKTWVTEDGFRLEMKAPGTKPVFELVQPGGEGTLRLYPENQTARPQPLPALPKEGRRPGPLPASRTIQGYQCNGYLLSYEDAMTGDTLQMTLWLAEDVPSQHASLYLRTMAELLQKAQVSQDWLYNQQGLLLGLDATMPVRGQAGQMPLIMRYTASTIAAEPVEAAQLAIPPGWQILPPLEGTSAE